MDIVKKMYGGFLFCLKTLCGADTAKAFDAKFRFNRRISAKNPQTLSDKLSYIENHCRTELMASCTDKWAVREYIQKKGLGDILIPVFGEAYSDFGEIPFEAFPDRFVLKATHGCKMNFICEDKSVLDLMAVKKTVNKWLKTTYGAYSCEWHYLKIPKRVYCEEFMQTPNGLIDYKIHCINGEPSFILVCSGRNVDDAGNMSIILNVFDVEWNHVDCLIRYKNEVPGDGKIEKPETLEKMLEIARVLSADFDFVRVDLYDIDGKIYFGELTFTPGACIFPYLRDDFLEKEGEKLMINTKGND